MCSFIGHVLFTFIIIKSNLTVKVTKFHLERVKKDQRDESELKFGDR